ncbi:MAG: phosphate signaling complex protein PhoU [bacterium]
MKQLYFETEYENLRKRIITMAAEVEQQMNRFIQAYTNRDEGLAEQIIYQDSKIDVLQMEIDELCVTLFAKFQPMAHDLRFVVAVIKINNDLERIADEIANITRRLAYLLPRPRLKADLMPMAALAQEMLHLVVDALVNDRLEYCDLVLEKEKRMDDFLVRNNNMIIDIMKQESGNIKRGFNLIMMAKCLERIGDLTTNVAEDIIYYIKAKDIRHSRGQVGNGD